MVILDSNNIPSNNLEVLRLFSPHPEIEDKILYCNTTLDMMLNVQKFIELNNLFQT
jgi:hypothetical protein